MFTKTKPETTAKLLTAILASTLLLTACAPAVSSVTQTNPTETSEAPVTSGSLRFSMDAGSMATGTLVETVAAVPVNDNAPYWEVLPEYTRVTLQGYPVSSHIMQPQIFIYPVEEMIKANESTGQIAAALQALLQAPGEMTPMPFLPLFNAAQVMHANVQYLDFKTGQGLRYLTMFSQGIVPINNNELIYTFQGLTSDRRYYVAAVLPVTHPSLPADGNVSGNEPPEFTSDFSAYLKNTAASLNNQAAETFTPNLALLDAMMSSLEIR
jgi:hypothetical protein